MTDYKRGIDEFDPEDLILPEMKLIQNTGGADAKAAGAKPGDFFCTLTGQNYNQAFEMIFVDMHKTRTFWGRTDITDGPPECASQDARTSLDGKDCKTCEFFTDAPWALPKDKRREMCTMTYVIKFFLADGTPMIIRAGGISARAARELYTLLRMNQALNGDFHKGVIEVKSILNKSTSGEAYAMKFRLDRMLDKPEQIEKAKATSMRLLAASFDMSGEDSYVEPVAPVETPAGEAPAPAPAEIPENLKF